MVSGEALFYLILLTLLSGIGSVFLTGFTTSILFFGKYQTKELLKKTPSKFILFHYLLKKLFKNNEFESLNACISITKLLLRISYSIFGMLFFLSIYPQSSGDWNYFILIGFVLLILILAADFLMRISTTLSAITTLKFSSLISSIFLLILFPITAPLIKVLGLFYQKGQEKEQVKRESITKDKVIEMLQDFGLSRVLDNYDKKVIASLVTFREKVTREIMVPRVDLCCLPVEATVRDAAKIFLEEGYSRIPVYKETLDHILGVLMYKDVMEIYNQSDEEGNKKLLQNPLDKLLKPVIYAPENKKISQLFQEFRNKQTHIAIIVNEYGGTEGIVTIEDILEELVGEIEDEYDIEEEKQYWKMPNGSWVVDAKMSIIDLENQLNIKIPHSPEYETIGGYVFHRAGTIPSKGWKIHLDEYELEVLISNERCIEKIRIMPIQVEKS